MQVEEGNYQCCSRLENAPVYMFQDYRKHIIDSTLSSRKNGTARCRREIGFSGNSRVRNQRVAIKGKIMHERAGERWWWFVYLSFSFFFLCFTNKMQAYFLKKPILIAKLSFFSPRISPYFSCILICNTLKHTKTIIYRGENESRI